MKTSLPLALALIFLACSPGGGDAREPEAVTTSRGRQLDTDGGQALDFARADTASQTQPDVGRTADTLSADALMVTDAAPVQTDVLVQHPDVQVAPDTAPAPDTKLQPDSRLAPTCRWRNAQSGQVADVYAVDVDATNACGTVLENGSSCYVGCAAKSVIVSFEIAALSPVGQPIDLADGSCTARIMTDAASLPALCFSTPEACAKACR